MKPYKTRYNKLRSMTNLKLVVITVVMVVLVVVVVMVVIVVHTQGIRQNCRFGSQYVFIDGLVVLTNVLTND